MRAVNVALRAIYKPAGVRTSIEDLQARSVPDPPPKIAKRHQVEVTRIAGVRCVRLDPGRERTLVFLHGGTYHSGPLPQQWDWLSAICRATGSTGLLVDYSLTPQRAFPVALDEVLAVLETVDAPYMLAGDSAGGGLALGAAYALRDAGDELPAGLVLSSPWLDVTMSDPQIRANQRVDPMLSLRGLARGAEPYAQGSDPRDPRISPLYGDPAGLPPMVVHAGTRELFVHDCRTWKQKCDAAGTRCDYFEVDGAFHDFVMAITLLPEAKRGLAEQVEFVRAVLAG